MFCGFLTSRGGHLSIQSGAALIPLVFLCVDRDLVAGDRDPGWFRRGRGRLLAAAAVAVALQSVSGHPQVPIYTSLALGMYALMHGVARWWTTQDYRSLYRPLTRLAAIYVLAYSLAAIQLVPWVELGTFSPRAASASFEFVLGNSMTGADWLLMLFPYLNGSLGPTIYGAHPPPITVMVRTWEHSGYVGILPLGLAAFALLGAFRRPDPKVVQFGLLLLAATLFATGQYTPVGDVIYHLPVIGRLREVERAMALVDFALATLAVLGAQRFLTLHLASAGGSATEPGRHRSAPALAVAAALVVLPILVVAAGQSAAVQGLWRLGPQAIDNLWFTRPAVLIPLLIAVTSGSLLGWWSQQGLNRFGLGLAAALVMLDLGSYAALFNPLASTGAVLRAAGSVVVVQRA